jgi:hypothetical protein
VSTERGRPGAGRCGDRLRRPRRRPLAAAELIKKHKPKSLGWLANGPAAALIADLLIMKGVKPVELMGVDVSAACQGFAEQISSRQLVHGNDPRLTPTSSAARSCPAETAGGSPGGSETSTPPTPRWEPSRLLGSRRSPDPEARQREHLIGPARPPVQSPCAQARVSRKVTTHGRSRIFPHEARAAHGVRIGKARYSFTLRRGIPLSSGWSGSSARQMALWSPCRQSEGYGVA